MLANVDDDAIFIKYNDAYKLFMKGNLLWHSDSSDKTVLYTYSLLVAHEVPSVGGNTEFADMRACYDDWQGPIW
jgi:alpha-ketoglutarate-dependent 2,4-dichlorophenoxyacetate dioxygenase